MTFKASGRGFKSLKLGDKNFTFSPDGVTIVPRASLEITSSCPSSYRQIIATAFQNGWIVPVATMRDTEYLVEVLKE